MVSWRGWVNNTFIFMINSTLEHYKVLEGQHPTVNKWIFFLMHIIMWTAFYGLGTLPHTDSDLRVTQWPYLFIYVTHKRTRWILQNFKQHSNTTRPWHVLHLWLNDGNNHFSCFNLQQKRIFVITFTITLQIVLLLF